MERGMKMQDRIEPGYDLQKEAEILQEEVRDINTKSIAIGKHFVLVVLAFFTYVALGISLLAASPDRTGGRSHADAPRREDADKQVDPNSQGAGRESQEVTGVPKALALGAKIYSLAGILFTATLLVTWFYLSGQWASSKKHRIRY